MKILYTIIFYLQFLCVARYLKRSNDTPKFNTHKYDNYNIIEIYINRLCTTMQVFYSNGLLDPGVKESTFILEHDKRMYQEIFSRFVDVTESIFRITCISKICIKTWKKLEFLSFTWVWGNNKFEIMELWLVFRVRILILVSNILSFTVFEERCKLLVIITC